MWKIEKNGVNEDGEELVLITDNQHNTVWKYREWEMTWNEMVALYWAIGKVMGRD